MNQGTAVKVEIMHSADGGRSRAPYAQSLSVSGHLPVIAGMALLAAAVIWGSSYLVVGDVLAKVSVPEYLCVRFLLALPIVAIAFWRTVTQWFRTSIVLSEARAWRILVSQLIPGAFLAAAIVLQAFGMRAASPGVAAFLTSLVFLFVPILELISGHRNRLGRVGLILPLALAGTYLLTRPEGSASLWAMVLLLGGAACYAGQIFHSARLARNTPPPVVFLLQSLVVLVVSAIWFLGTSKSFQIPSIGVLMSVAYVAIVATAGCYLIQFWAQRFIRASYVSLIYSIEPVAALALSAVLHREVLTAASIAGASLLIATAFIAIYISSRDQKL